MVVYLVLGICWHLFFLPNSSNDSKLNRYRRRHHKEKNDFFVAINAYILFTIVMALVFGCLNYYHNVS